AATTAPAFLRAQFGRRGAHRNLRTGRWTDRHDGGRNGLVVFTLVDVCLAVGCRIVPEISQPRGASRLLRPVHSAALAPALDVCGGPPDRRRPELPPVAPAPPR